MNRNRNRWYDNGATHTALLLVVLMALSIAACKPPEAPKAKEVEVKPTAVETLQLSAKTFDQFLEYPGKAEPVQTQRVSAEASGRALSVPFEEGDTVKKGQMMLRVDARMNTAQINVLKTQLRSAERELNRTKKLAGEGLATPQQLDQAQSGVDQLRMSIKQARTGLSMSSVRSGFTGYVMIKHVKKGEFIGAGQPVATIIDVSTIKVKINVPESAVKYIKVGAEIDLHFSALEKTIKGKIKKRDIIAEQPSQTYPVEVHLDNKSGEILPGMRATARIPKVTIKDAIVVPRDAILEGVERREAMVATDIKDGIAKSKLRLVELGESKGNKVVVTKGLKPGDQLIVLGHRGIVDGTSVRIVRQRKEK